MLGGAGLHSVVLCCGNPRRYMLEDAPKGVHFIPWSLEINVSQAVEKKTPMRGGWVELERETRRS